MHIYLNMILPKKKFQYHPKNSWKSWQYGWLKHIICHNPHVSLLWALLTIEIKKQKFWTRQIITSWHKLNNFIRKLRENYRPKSNINVNKQGEITSRKVARDLRKNLMDDFNLIAHVTHFLMYYVNIKAIP